MQTQLTLGATSSTRGPRRLAFRFALVALAMGLVLLIQGARTHSVFADDCDSDSTAVEECSVVVQPIPTATATAGSGNVIGAASVTIPPASRMWIHTDKKFAFAYDPIRICWQLPAAGMYHVIDETSDGNRTEISSGYSDGSTSCLNGFITPPFGQECMRLVYTPLTGFGVAISTASFRQLPYAVARTCFFTNG